MNDLNDFDEINQLLDFYSSLLTDKQAEIMEYYYHENYSLMEISELLNISRAAVNDAIKRSQKNLKNYEEKLQLVYKFQERKKIYAKLEKQIENKKYIEKLKNLE